MEFSTLFTLFTTAFLAATILPASSEALLIYLLNQDNQSIPILILCATAGNILGGVLNYFLGHLGKLDWCAKYLGVKKKQIDYWQARVNEYGSVLALCGWMPFIGDPLMVALGYFRCSFKKVLIFMSIGKFLRYLFLAYTVHYLNF